MEYDVIVIGAGNAGLVSALTLQKKGKKVLILEKSKMAGGVSSSFKRGIFEFDISLSKLTNYGNEENKGEIFHLFDRLGISSKITMKELEYSFHIIDKEKKESYTFPVGIDNFIEQMEAYVPNSKVSMITFFGLAEEMRDAFNYYNEQQVKNTEDLYLKFPNFVQLAPCKTKEVLKKIGMPEKAIELLVATSLPEKNEDENFVSFALHLENSIKFPSVIPTLTSHEISSVLEKEFLNMGGKINYFKEVEEIEVENKMVKKVKTKDKSYLCNHVIANISPITVYCNLIKKEEVPKEAFGLQNSRDLGAKCITVYLGLNKSPKEIGLTKYQYIILNSLQSEKEFKKMNQIKNGNLYATIRNNGVEVSSREGTTEITLTSYFYGRDFEKEVNSSNYYEKKQEFAEFLIESFEASTNTSIKEYIEEIEIATPVTFNRYTSHPFGVVKGFNEKGYDNFLSRYFTEEKETFIKGLSFCGGFGSRASGYENTYLNGEEVANKVYEECMEK